MPKIKKKGKAGQAKNFITRTQAVRKLQISLPDFRRLCIFKGIYPREPRNKKKASKSSTPSTTFYYTKDIQYLLHEPLLNKFREHKSLAKKIGRALGRGEVGTASRLEKTQTPRLSLDHVIKERYPTFVDALRDLDDALSMLFLFANLPSTATVPTKTIALCQRLCLEFQHYIIATHSLRKSFLSIKGIYYQATIQGQDILWLVPYKFVQRVTGDVDFRIMGTFVEFYTTLLGFVNFRLYTSIGLIYPPKFNKTSDEQGGELSAFSLEGKRLGPQREPPQDKSTDERRSPNAIATISSTAQASADALANLSELHEDSTLPPTVPTRTNEDAIDTFESTDPNADTLAQPQFSSHEAHTLFSKFTFFLSRETPRQPLEFLLKAFGCKRIGWDSVLGDGAWTGNEVDERITHQIIDRPPLGSSNPDNPPANGGTETEVAENAKFRGWPYNKVPGRTYVQPQWVWDCINEGKLLRPDLYAAGATLPPHLSPWVRPGRGYDPRKTLEEQEIEGEAAEAEAREEEAEKLEGDGEVEAGDDNAVPVTDEGDDDVEAGEGMAVAGSESSSDELEDGDKAIDDEWAGIDEFAAEDADLDSAELTRLQQQSELEAEAAGLPYAAKPATSQSVQARDEAVKKAARRRKEQEEELARQRMMMSRKKRKLLDRVLMSKRREDEEAEKLRGKRRKLEKSGRGVA